MERITMKYYIPPKRMRLFSAVLTWSLGLIFFLALPTAGDSAETIYENTKRSGPVNSNERWRGIIDITGDVTVYDPAVLTIEPGTIVRFAANSDDRAEGGDTPLSVFSEPFFPHDPPTPPSQISALGVYGGTLFAVGTADKPIVFTSSASNPVRGDWHLIGYHKEGSRLILRNTIIEYGYYGVLINTAATNDEVTIQDNTIRHIVATGVGAATPSMLIIANNDISDCGHELIDIGPNTTLLIENNVLHDNWWSFGDGGSGPAIAINNSNSIIRNNQFVRNRCAIGFNVSSHTSISGNVFRDNVTNCCGYCPVPLQPSKGLSSILPLLLND